PEAAPPAIGAASAPALSDSACAIVPAAVPASVPAATGPRRLVSGQAYSYIKDGVRHYTSTRPKGGTQVASLRTIKYRYIETCFACGNPGVDFGRLRLNTSAYAAEIAAASREFGVEESIL